jgi:hypothetical protein
MSDRLIMIMLLGAVVMVGLALTGVLQHSAPVAHIVTK